MIFLYIFSVCLTIIYFTIIHLIIIIFIIIINFTTVINFIKIVKRYLTY